MDSCNRCNRKMKNSFFIRDILRNDCLQTKSSKQVNLPKDGDGRFSDDCDGTTTSIRSATTRKESSSTRDDGFFDQSPSGSSDTASNSETLESGPFADNYEYRSFLDDNESESFEQYQKAGKQQEYEGQIEGDSIIFCL